MITAPSGKLRKATTVLWPGAAWNQVEYTLNSVHNLHLDLSSLFQWVFMNDLNLKSVMIWGDSCVIDPHPVWCEFFEGRRGEN